MVTYMARVEACLCVYHGRCLPSIPAPTSLAHEASDVRFDQNLRRRYEMLGRAVVKSEDRCAPLSGRAIMTTWQLVLLS